MEAPIGKTKDVGYQFGLQKTFRVSEKQAWDFMFSDAGLSIWLGDLETDLALKENYQTQSGIEGFVRVFEPYSHIRMNWKKKAWKNESTVQVRVMGKDKNKTVISFHQERLLDSGQRVEMKAYWTEKMNEIAEQLQKQATG